MAGKLPPYTQLPEVAPPPYTYSSQDPHRPVYAEQHHVIRTTHQGYGPPPQQVVVVNNQPGGLVQADRTVIVTTTPSRPPVNHILHLIITIFFWPWVFVWLALVLAEGR